MASTGKSTRQQLLEIDHNQGRPWCREVQCNIGGSWAGLRNLDKYQKHYRPPLPASLLDSLAAVEGGTQPHESIPREH